MMDFFISYTGDDSSWAEWIAYVIEEKGFKTILQAWDFRPGSNFVLEMQKAMTNAERTIMVLSPEYLQSVFAAPEWAGAFAQDPEGLKRKLVPVMVKACQPQGLLAPIVHISIVGLAEDGARDKLLAGIDATRAKPSSRPAFPGAAPASNPQRAFPGSAPARQPTGAAAYMPTVHRPPTDIDKRRFIKQSFETIRSHFENGLQALSQQQGIEHDFTPATALEFSAEVFLDGRSRCFSRIWLGGMHSENNICVAETRSLGGNGCNEIITLSDRREGLGLSATTAMSHTPFERAHDMKQLTPDEAADYLWQRFVAPLERRR